MKACFIALAASIISLTGIYSLDSVYSLDRNYSLDSNSGFSGVTGQTSIIFTGDILLDRGVREVIGHHGIDYLFTRQIDSLFRASQVVVGNLECPATKIQAPVQKLYIFRAEPEWLTALKKHGITHLNLANNHAVDQGRRGLTDTKAQIKKAGIVPIGAGSNMQEAAQPILLATTPRKVWLVASLRLALENFAYLEDRPCVSQEPMEKLIGRVRKLKRDDPTSIVIVSLHWGGEHTLKPVPQQRLEAHRIIDAGADALICHHTHTLQTIETYHGKNIYYSIGNFIFDQQKPFNRRACMVKLTVTKNSMETESIPIEIRNCRPCLSR
jgi:poly-gamma-glutamate synthesis protein (capsule biosynthesis protein)